VFVDGDGLVLGEVLQTEMMSEGDVVVTGGVEGVLPPGLVIGQIESIVSTEVDVTKKAKVTPMYKKEGWAAIW
jgi:cell shape-determining protein MreC